MNKEIVAIVAYEDNPAVCSSMMMHVDMIHEAGYSIIMFINTQIPKTLFNKVGYKVVFYTNPKELTHLFKQYEINKVWCTNPMYVLKLLRLTKLPIYLWKQGDTAAESFMRHRSYLRKWGLQLIDAYTLRKVKGVVYVSDAMKEFYEKKYRLLTNSIIVPCLSDFAEIEISVDRIPDSFVYIGGLSVWQCFEETLLLYAKLRTPNSTFHIITLDVETARNKVLDIIGDDHNIEIYGITDRTQIPAVLNRFQYGFLIRKKDVVNMVAAPIKFLEYLSCGVNIIMTDAVPSYAKLVERNHIGAIVDVDNHIISLKPFNPNAKQVYLDNFNHKRFVNEYKKLLMN